MTQSSRPPAPPRGAYLQYADGTRVNLELFYHGQTGDGSHEWRPTEKVVWRPGMQLKVGWLTRDSCVTIPASAIIGTVTTPYDITGPGHYCQHCGMRSNLPADKENAYCGNCHHFCDDVYVEGKGK